MSRGFEKIFFLLLKPSQITTDDRVDRPYTPSQSVITTGGRLPPLQTTPPLR